MPFPRQIRSSPKLVALLFVLSCERYCVQDGMSVQRAAGPGGLCRISGRVIPSLVNYPLTSTVIQ
jgi:hypothetical protein